MQYQLKEGQYRIGYILGAALEPGEMVESMDYPADLFVRTTQTVQLTDDPLGQQAPIREIKEGTEIHHLASIKDWFYVEVSANGIQRAIRGFVPDTAFIQEVTNMWYNKAYPMPGYTAQVSYGVYFMNAVYENHLDTADPWQVDFTIEVTGQNPEDTPIEGYRLYNAEGELVNESPSSEIDPAPRLNDTFFLGLSLDGTHPTLTLVPFDSKNGVRVDEKIIITIE